MKLGPGRLRSAVCPPRRPVSPPGRRTAPGHNVTMRPGTDNSAPLRNAPVVAQRRVLRPCLVLRSSTRRHWSPYVPMVRFSRLSRPCGKPSTGSLALSSTRSWSSSRCTPAAARFSSSCATLVAPSSGMMFPDRRGRDHPRGPQRPQAGPPRHDVVADRGFDARADRARSRARPRRRGGDRRARRAGCQPAWTVPTCSTSRPRIVASSPSLTPGGSRAS